MIILRLLFRIFIYTFTLLLFNIQMKILQHKTKILRLKNDYFGATRCEVCLGSFIIYGAIGARNQIMMNRLAKKLEEDPDYEGEGMYQQV